MMAQVESLPHDAAAVDGDTPATGAWNLGDQTVREIGDDLAFEIPAQLWVNDCENQVGE